MGEFDHIRWLGGGTGAGKTTVARKLGERPGVSVLSTDATIHSHSAMLSAAEAPLLERFCQTSIDERWVLRDPVEMYRTFPWFHGEGFALLLEDLRALPTDQITVIEGFRLLPELVRPLLSTASSSVWLIPTADFRRAAFAARTRGQAFWLRTGDPQQALENLLARDEIFTAEIAAAATRYGLPSIPIDGERDANAAAAIIADPAAIIADQFGL